MDFEQAVKILRKAVKHTGTIDQKHIDLTVIPVEERELYEKALVVTQLAVKEGKLSKEELIHKLHLV